MISLIQTQCIYDYGTLIIFLFKRTSNSRYNEYINNFGAKTAMPSFIQKHIAYVIMVYLLSSYSKYTGNLTFNHYIYDEEGIYIDRVHLEN